MKNAIMEPVGDLEVLHEGHFTWEIHNYQKLKDRTLSPEYELGGYKWSPPTPSLYKTQLTLYGTGGFYILRGETLRKKIRPPTSKPFLPKMPPQTGTSAHNSQSPYGTPPTQP